MLWPLKIYSLTLKACPRFHSFLAEITHCCSREAVIDGDAFISSLTGCRFSPANVTCYPVLLPSSHQAPKCSIFEYSLFQLLQILIYHCKKVSKAMFTPNESRLFFGTLVLFRNKRLFLLLCCVFQVSFVLLKSIPNIEHY